MGKFLFVVNMTVYSIQLEPIEDMSSTSRVGNKAPNLINEECCSMFNTVNAFEYRSDLAILNKAF